MKPRTKTFDCVRMKREIQERANQATAGMTPAQRDAWTRERAKRFRRSGEVVAGGGVKALFEAMELEREGRGNL